jgi:hypothetical protein
MGVLYYWGAEVLDLGVFAVPDIAAALAGHHRSERAFDGGIGNRELSAQCGV